MNTTAPTMYGPWSWKNLSGGDLPAVVDVMEGRLSKDMYRKAAVGLTKQHLTAGLVSGLADGEGGAAEQMRIPKQLVGRVIGPSHDSNHACVVSMHRPVSCRCITCGGGGYRHAVLHR